MAIDSGLKCVASVDNVWGGRVKVLKRPGHDVTPSAGARARMHAIEHSHPDATHFAFLDDDDVWLPTKLEVQLEAMARDRSLVLVSSDALYPAKGEAARCQAGSYVPWPLFHNATVRSWFKPWNRGLYRKPLTKMFHGECYLPACCTPSLVTLAPPPAPLTCLRRPPRGVHRLTPSHPSCPDAAA